MWWPFKRKTKPKVRPKKSPTLIIDWKWEFSSGQITEHLFCPGCSHAFFSRGKRPKTQLEYCEGCNALSFEPHYHVKCPQDWCDCEFILRTRDKSAAASFKEVVSNRLKFFSPGGLSLEDEEEK